MHTIFVLYSDVSDERTFYSVFDRYVSAGSKCTLYLYFIVTLVMSAFSVLYLIAALEISTHYICTL